MWTNSFKKIPINYVLHFRYQYKYFRCINFSSLSVVRKRNFSATSVYFSVKLNSEDKPTYIPKTTSNSTLLEKLVNKCPSAIKPYLKLIRFDKPTGTFLLLWPCYWSLSLATLPGSFPDPSLLALFAAGAFLMRGAGCTINDLWDKDIDAKVSRTKDRPLACGNISIVDAWMFLGGQLSLALLVLLQFNWYSIVLGASSLGLVVTYPLVKRVSYWPQLMLGLTFNWGALLGWCSLHGSCNWSVVLPLYLACISWTMIYDTVYAHQDKVDDVLIKIKSTAIKFGENTKYYLSGFSLSMIGFLMLAGYSSYQTWPFYATLGISSVLLMSQITALNINDPKSCWKMFKSNQKLGLYIFLGIIGGTLLKEKSESKSSQNLLTTKPLLTPPKLVTNEAFS